MPATPQEAADWVEDWRPSGPSLLVVEDAHWADPSTLEAVHLIARSDAPVLVVMSARPGDRRRSSWCGPTRGSRSTG